jgi:glycosyltransferase involved in cell wall biosynthesis
MWYYGSIYNDLLPVFEEYRLAKKVKLDESPIVHFMWADFASPSVGHWFRGKKGLLIGTYHSAASRLKRVCSRTNIVHKYDGIMLMSESQRAFFIEAGYPDDRLRVVRHGVNLAYFRPLPDRVGDERHPLRLLLIGATQRDHLFAAQVMQNLPPDICHLYVRTAREQEVHYRGVANVTLLPRLSDEELLKQYQQADLLFMPMIDCTANNVILEGMACGTPVLANRVGGIPEYVNPSCNFVLSEKIVDAWCGKLCWLNDNRERLNAYREQVRLWAEQFSWVQAGKDLLEFYDDISSKTV